MDGELAIVLSSIALACKQIASLVTRAGISNLTGLGGLSNSSVRSKSRPHFARVQVFAIYAKSACLITTTVAPV